MSCCRVFAFAVLALSFASAVAAADDWTGPYVGVFVGYTDASDAWDQSGAPGDPVLSPEGIEVGGLAGYGFASHGLLLGIEADLSFPDFGDDTDCGAGFDCTLDVRILSSLRGRAGVAAGPVLFYGTGGFAFGVVQAEVATPGGGSDSEGLAGWTLGGGIEFTSGVGVRVGAEYRHSDYGSAGIAGVSGNDEISLETDEFRLRLSVPLN